MRVRPPTNTPGPRRNHADQIGVMCVYKDRLLTQFHPEQTYFATPTTEYGECICGTSCASVKGALMGEQINAVSEPTPGLSALFINPLTRNGYDECQ